MSDPKSPKPEARSQHSFIPEAKTKAREVKAVSVPSLEVPKGGGAIRGIGETFSSNLAMGTGGMSVPIAVSPGRAGVGPQLSVSYSSGSGNGLFGLGWSMPIPSVRRRTDKRLPTYDDAHDEDTFLFGGEEELVPALKNVATGEDRDRNPNWQPDVVNASAETHDERRERFRPRTEGSFSRIERITKPGDPSVRPFWRVTDRNNVVTEYGRTAATRVANPRSVQPEAPSLGGTLVFEWLIDRQYDDKGNLIVYEYVQEDGVSVDHSLLHEKHRGDESYGARYPKRILYSNRVPFVPDAAASAALTAADFLFEVVFDYGDHPGAAPTPTRVEPSPWPVRLDPFSSHRAGFELRTQRLCQRVLMFHRIDDANVPVLVRSTDFAYAPSPTATLLTAVTHTSYVRSGTSYVSDAMPPVQFTYSAATLDTRVHAVSVGSLLNAPEGLDGDRYRWVDLDMEGIPGLLTEQGGHWYYKRNLGDAVFGPLEALPTLPVGASLRSPTQVLADLGGDGGLQLVCQGEHLQGFFERTPEGSWGPFQTFARTLNLDLHDPNLRLLDLNGDGRPEVVITTDEALTWYPSEGRLGYGPPHTTYLASNEDAGPRLVFADREQSIFLADMSGDGLLDLVRIRNGSVCYWPSLGYGHFGAKVSMTHAPVMDADDMFRTDRIRLADLDGTGTTDLVYLGAHGRHGARIWRNQAGNAFSAAEVVANVPALTPMTHVSVLDLLGSGTASIVWSSSAPGDAPVMKYIDLLGGVKPYLLVGVTNNLGRSTELRYESSLRHYLRDERAGAPWETRIPFPVQVVGQVVTRDEITGSSHTVSYRYHHGFYDREEREFRGFGMTEQTDAESFAPAVGDGLFGAGPDVVMAVPPVVTKTWSHTGVYVGGKPIEARFRREYWQGDATGFVHQRLPMTELPTEGTPTERRHMVRALRGHTVRTEVYANDGTAQAGAPYQVTEATYAVRPVQPARGRHPAVVMAVPQESVAWHYERNASDPRVVHTLTLEVDHYGVPTATATVGYPRRPAASAAAADERYAGLDAATRDALIAAQSTMTVTLATTRVTHEATELTRYRLAAPVETATYEVVGLTVPTLAAVTAITPGMLFDRAGLLSSAVFEPLLSDSVVEVAFDAPPPPPPPRRRR